MASVRRWAVASGIVLVALAALAALLLALNLGDEHTTASAASDTSTASPGELVARGAYLARAGNCAVCHTARGGEPYAGGRGIATPFGTVYASNLTPDERSGLRTWTQADFWRALHNGRSKSGRLLYPAFPYPSYTQVTRADSDAIFAYLKNLPAVHRPNREHELRFPYRHQAVLAVWRALFFEPGVYEADATRSAEWNRGAYLTRGLGHCNACHSARNAFGATSGKLELSGGLIPMQNWYAPSLTADDEAGVARWDVQHIVDLLKTGVSPNGSVLGPMAEVVYHSTQHLSDPDLRAIAMFLKELPAAPPARRPADTRPQAAAPDALERGAKVYETHCAGCHGDAGQGGTLGYPPLAGNRAVTMNPPANVIRAILSGGFPPSTHGNPRPFGMPPFGTVLTEAEVAAVATYIRASWGNRAPPVSTVDVNRYRAGS